MFILLTLMESANGRHTIRIGVKNKIKNYKVITLISQLCLDKPSKRLLFPCSVFPVSSNTLNAFGHANRVGVGKPKTIEASVTEK